MGVSNNFKKERERIRERIWSFIQIKDDVVLDVGVGDEAHSTKKLIDLGAKVIAIDIDWKNLSKHKGIDAKLVQCDASQLPFRNSVFDLAVAYFTMHEINPELHLNVVSELARTSKKIMLIEANPGQDLVYMKCHDLWNKAMHALGKFEDLRELEYWKALVERYGFKLTIQEKIVHKEKMSPGEVDNFIRSSINAMNDYGISRKYIKEMRALAKDLKQKGMRLSDITVLIGEKS